MSLSPNLFLVGPPKTGTTSLYDSLGTHPRIYCPRLKEPCHLTWLVAGAPHWAVKEKSEYLSAYKAAYSSAYAYAVDGSTWSFSFSGVATKILQYCANPRVVITLRNPVDRIVSHYLFNVSNGWEDRDHLGLALEQEIAGLIPAHCLDRMYLRASSYFPAVHEFIDVLGPESVKVIIFEDFVKSSDQVIDDLLNWLDLGMSSECSSRVSNVTSKSFVRKFVNTLPAKDVVLALWKALPGGVFKSAVKHADSLVSRLYNPSKSRVSDETLLFLRNYFLEDANKLSRIVGRDLCADWGLAGG